MLPTQILTAKEVSERFFDNKKSPWAVLQAAKKRQLPSFRIGRKVYFSEAEIIAYIARLSADSVDDSARRPYKGIRPL